MTHDADGWDAPFAARRRVKCGGAPHCGPRSHVQPPGAHPFGNRATSSSVTFQSLAASAGSSASGLDFATLQSAK